MNAKYNLCFLIFALKVNNVITNDINNFTYMNVTAIALGKKGIITVTLWIVRAWRSEDVVLYGKVGPPLLS